MEAGIDAIVKALPGFTAMGTTGIIIFVCIVAGYIVLRIVLKQAGKPSSGETHADSKKEVAEKTDVENPALNDALKKDQDKVGDLVE